jgi:hypothetical protein
LELRSTRKTKVSQIISVFNVDPEEFWKIASRLLFRSFLSKAEPGRSYNFPYEHKPSIEDSKEILADHINEIPDQSFGCKDKWDGQEVNVLHWLFSRLGASPPRSSPSTHWNGWSRFHDEVLDDYWSRFVKSAIDAGADLHLAESRDEDLAQTPFFMFYRNYIRHHYDADDEAFSREALDRTCKSMVTSLCNIGVNILDFGEVESQILERNLRLPYTKWSHYGHKLYEWAKDVRGLAYGPNISDWRFEYRAGLEDSTEMFWRLVERPVSIHDLMEDLVRIDVRLRYFRTHLPYQHVPGAWIEQTQTTPYSFCGIIASLAEMSQAQYADLVDQVADFDFDSADSIDGKGGWLWLGDTRRCNHTAADPLICHLCEEYSERRLRAEATAYTYDDWDGCDVICL